MPSDQQTEPANDTSAVELDPLTRRRLESVATATLAGTLQKHGVRTTFLSGLKPIKPGQRMIGRARTLRFLPMREDLLETFAPRLNMQRAAIESLQPGEVLVIDARNETDAGTIGDIFAMRAIQLGAVGVVTDGAVRDTPALRDMGLSMYHRASHGGTYRRLHMPVDQQIPIACAGVTVMPGDVIVGDDEGVVVVPWAMVDQIAADAAQLELEETWAMSRVAAGESTDGAFPITPARRPEFEAWAAEQRGPDDDVEG
jgi:5-oxopent-3-ene-1,2,5-tricarboxylate decarboxylase/2-hydroxyhepta-2,4-diene-1,7-dioate isomerase